jgi:hypothetical protein
MSLTQKELLFWIAAVVIILGVLAAAQFRRHTISDRTMFLVGLIGGIVIFRVGVQVIWTGIRSRQRSRLWWVAR